MTQAGRLFTTVAALAALSTCRRPLPSAETCATVTKVTVMVSHQPLPRVSWEPACPMGSLLMERIDNDPIRHYPWALFDPTNGIASGVVYPDSAQRLVRGQRYRFSVGQYFPDAGIFTLGEAMFIR